MTGRDGFDPLGLEDLARAYERAVAVEQLEAARRRVITLREEVAAAASDLAQAGRIAWSGAAAEAWRTGLERHRWSAQRAAQDLDELGAGLTRLIARLSP